MDFSLAGTTMSSNLVALQKIWFPELVVDEHPALVINSTSLHYDIILAANFLDKCGIILDYDNILVLWMEYTNPLCNTTEFFHTVTTPLSSHQLRLNLKMASLAVPMLTNLQLASLMQNKNKSTFMMLPLTNITFCLTSNKTSSIYHQNTKKYLMDLLESTLIRKFTFTCAPLCLHCISFTLTNFQKRT